MTNLTKFITEARERIEKATPREKWVPVNGFDAYYEVSDMGRIRSYLKPGNSDRELLKQPRLMRMSSGKYRKSVGLRDKNGKYHKRRVYQVVMAAFVGPRPEGYDVAHLNGDMHDNRLANLIYCTRKENESHKIAHGTRATGQKNGASKLLSWEVEEMRFLHSKGIPQIKLAKFFGVHPETIRSIVNNEIWKDIPSRTDLEKAIAALEVACEALEKYADNSVNDDPRYARDVARDAQARIEELLKS